MFTVLNGLKQIAVALLLLLVFVLHTKINTTKGNTLYSSLEHLNKRVMLIWVEHVLFYLQQQIFLHGDMFAILQDIRGRDVLQGG